MDNYIKFNDKTILKIGDPNKRHIILNSDYAKRYMGYLLIMEDLKSVLEALDKLKTDIAENIIRESLSIFIVIVYGKAFSKADVRKVKLEKDQLKNLKSQQIVLHDVLIDIRNKHVAHAGSEIFSLSNLVMQFDESTANTFLSGLSLSSFNFNIESIEELVKDVLKICEIKADKAFKALDKSLLSLSEDEIQKKSFFPSHYKICSLEQVQNSVVELTKDYYNTKK
ncbi:MAG: hypothetical protein KKE39_09165 [Bacteroidetes bacterium]|nr:hypothetical protein [Bacteroidota bacterium]MBU1371178.1 hypothetical protein [Bacteroidota bacterium]MBU1486164.1 hypothetical protein [Bacteroidota bacterium]MBU1760667.1 hypothetical protein [Bacteroidota bacterium]MBU2267042.1 hypothetical protein [Bacteroidota bacterium]